MPVGLVTDPMFRWGADAPLRRGYADTIIYEVHVKGLTMRHPDVPEALRGTYAGLGHQAVVDYLTGLGRDRGGAAAGPPVRARAVAAGPGADQLLGL